MVFRYSIHYAGKCGFFLRSIDRKSGPGAPSSSSMSGGNYETSSFLSVITFLSPIFFLSPLLDLRTTKDWDRVHVIRAVFGKNAASNLIPLSHEDDFNATTIRQAVNELGLKFNGLLSDPGKVTSGKGVKKKRKM